MQFKDGVADGKDAPSITGERRRRRDIRRSAFHARVPAIGDVRSLSACRRVPGTTREASAAERSR